MREVQPHRTNGEDCQQDAAEHEGLAPISVTQISHQGGKEEGQKGVCHQAVQAGPANNLRMSSLHTYVLGGM